MKPLRWLLLLGTFAAFAGSMVLGGSCAGGDDDDSIDSTGFRLTSPAFDPLGEIPAKYTCDNPDADVSPPLEWFDPPQGTVAYALTCRDPDTPEGDTKHWGLINIPGDLTSLPEGLSKIGPPIEGTWEILNYKGEKGYAPPCAPPQDGPHHYHFTLTALNAEIEDPGTDMTLDEALPLIDAAAIEATTLTGLLDR